jgi:Conjugal transfer protein TraD
MADGLHTREQGLRLHHLANLGGLVALAGLDREPPDLLLGALLRMAGSLTEMPERRRAELASIGSEKLNERASAKRAWKSWARANRLHNLTLSDEQIRRILVALGGGKPVGTGERLCRQMLALLDGRPGDE